MDYSHSLVFTAFCYRAWLCGHGLHDNGLLGTALRDDC